MTVEDRTDVIVGAHAIGGEVLLWWDGACYQPMLFDDLLVGSHTDQEWIDAIREAIEAFFGTKFERIIRLDSKISLTRKEGIIVATTSLPLALEKYLRTLIQDARGARRAPPIAFAMPREIQQGKTVNRIPIDPRAMPLEGQLTTPW